VPQFTPVKRRISDYNPAIIGQEPITSMLIPSNGTALSGTSAVLDASASAGAGVATVQFVIAGGP
jgi:hypothetical protein